MRGVALVEWLMETAKHFADADGIVVCFLRRDLPDDGGGLVHQHAIHFEGELTTVEILGLIEKARIKVERAMGDEDVTVPAKPLLTS